jgi:hypothetical protein
MPHAICREFGGTDRAGQAENEGLSAAGQGSKSASELALRATQQVGVILEIAFVLACLNLTMPHRSCAASTVLRAFSLMPEVYMRFRVWVACLDRRILCVELPYLA